MAPDANYSETIKSLEERRSRLVFELEALTKAIDSLKSVDTPRAKTDTPIDISAAAEAPRVGIYSLIGIRWACLWILSQAGEVGLSTASVADLLLRGGRTSKADRFTSSVSAVLSSMKIKGEVEPIGNYWVLTDFGKSALEAIRPRLEVLAQQHLKYRKSDIDAMPLAKSRALVESNDQDYMNACDYYYGGANASSRPLP